MREDSPAQPSLAPPGRRTGEGAASILPYLLRSLASKPTPAAPDRSRQGASAGPVGPRPELPH